MPNPTDTHEATKSAFTFLRPTASVPGVRSARETQDTQGTGSYNYSDASSVGKFPAFHFSIHSLTSLSLLVAQAQSDIQKPGEKGDKTSQKATILAAVLEVDGPDTIHIKKGAEAGKEVSLLKIILGDEDGLVCKLTAWREVAESWGGADPADTTPRVKRGDIVLLESASRHSAHHRMLTYWCPYLHATRCTRFLGRRRCERCDGPKGDLACDAYRLFQHQVADGDLLSHHAPYAR